MRKQLILTICATLMLTGCARVADSRLNPLNWFGASQPAANVDQTGNLRPLVTGTGPIVVDGRGAIDEITDMRVERTAQGAIVRATGVASTQGQFNAQLVPVSNSGGVLVLAFRVEAPAGFAPGGSTFSRQITVARAFSDADLSGINTIRVQGARNARQSRR